MGYRFAVRRSYMLDRIRQNGRRFINMKRLFLGIIILLSVCRVFGEDAADKMILVKGGTYNWKKLLGIGSEEVTVPDLYVQKYETTRSEWEAFINETGKKEFYKITAVQLN